MLPTSALLYEVQRFAAAADRPANRWCWSSRRDGSKYIDELMSRRRRPALDFVGTTRFEIIRHLGTGGMGSVYEALDCELDAPVALKRLDRLEPERLIRFKREFREFQNLSHPNLVRLRELFSDGSEWFFSMELLDGVDFLEYVRPSVNVDMIRSLADTETETQTATPTARTITEAQPRHHTRPARFVRGPLDEERLRRALPQLVLGIMALHDAGKLHCDIKPSNVLVTREGRVVVLDYGVAVDLHDSKREGLLGTVAYMAPEQAAGQTTGPAADWYAVGVVLYETLTGRRPHEGTTLEILDAKQAGDGPSPRELAPAAPDDLCSLCEELMLLDPDMRPSGAQVLARLGAEPSSRHRRPRSPGFVGRNAQLAALEAAYRQSRERAQLVVVYGESGVGKSAVVRHFIEELRRDEPHAVALTGTCYERESVPYKAFDGVIDALGEYFDRLGVADALQLLPDNIALVAHAFPVLWGSSAVQAATASTAMVRPMDPREQRNRLFAAVRDALRRVGEVAPLVVAIDDLQWADADSRALLSELLAEPAAPRMLLVATVRTDSAADGSLERLQLGDFARGAARLPIERMLPDEARDLAARLVRESGGGRSELDPDLIARAADGHPLFLDALVRHAASGGNSSPPRISLDDVLWARIAPLPSDARRVLELVAVASGRIAQEAVGVAASLPFSVLSDHVALLRTSHLLATSGDRPRDQVAPYHDQIRRAVLARVAPTGQREHHRRLAEALEATNHIDPEALTVHWRECGELANAARFARLAGDKAMSALAFDRAAAFYEQCIALLGSSAPHDIIMHYAQALANAGRGGEAGTQYLLAAERASASESTELRRRAAEQLLRSGHVDQGLAALQHVCQPLGLKVTTTPKAALASLLYRRALVRARGLSFRERDETEVAASDLQKIDICWSVSAGLGLIDTIRGADFQSRQLLLALRAGEPYRVVRALAMETAYASAGGTATRARTEKLLRASEALASRIDRPHAIALTRWAAGMAAFLQGRWRDGFALSTQAEVLLRDECTGATWELDTARFMALWSAFYRGDIRELQRRIPALLLECEVRGDLYAATNLRTAMTPFLALVDDDPARSRAEAKDAITRWSRQGIHLQHCNAMFGHVQAALYEGAVTEARERIEHEFPNVERAMLLWVQQIRVRATHFRACARAAAGDIAGALDDIRRLEHEGAPWAHALAVLVRASIVQADRARELAMLRSAVSELDACDLGLYAGAARRRLALVETGSADALSVRAADDALLARGVRNPARMTAMLAPDAPRASTRR